MVGIVGAGKVGTALGRLARAAGWDVVLADTGRDPMKALVVETLVPGGRLAPMEEVARADIVVIAVPCHRAPTVRWDLLDERVVVDAMNYWAAVDGTVEDLAESGASLSELVVTRNPRMRLVKSLNHLGYHDMETDARPAGAPDRRAVAVASDDAGAREAVAGFVDAIGFDPVETSLATGVLLEAGGPVFGVALDRHEMLELLTEHSARLR